MLETGLRGCWQNTLRILIILLSASKEEIESIHEVGPRIAESVYDFFRTKSNLQMIKKLRDARLNFEMEQSASASNKLEGLTFVVTGSLEKYKREEVEELIETLRRQGGIISQQKNKLCLSGS